MSDITKGTRVINYAIDLICINLLTQLIADFYNIYHTTPIYFLIYLAYYFILELFFKQTLGKVITNTIVVDMHNQKPNILRILYRTVLRLNPFDTASYLFGQEQGAHDLLSKTRLVNKT